MDRLKIRIPQPSAADPDHYPRSEQGANKECRCEIKNTRVGESEISVMKSPRRHSLVNFQSLAAHEMHSLGNPLRPVDCGLLSKHTRGRNYQFSTPSEIHSLKRNGTQNVQNT